MEQFSNCCMTPTVDFAGSSHPLSQPQLTGHVARLPEDTPAQQALWCHIDLSLGHLPDPSWRRCTGRSRNRWLDQLCRDNGTPPADLWRRAVVWTLGGHTTVLDDYALTMMVTTVDWML